MIRVLTTIVALLVGAAAAYATCESLSPGSNLAVCLTPPIGLIVGAIGFWTTKPKKVRPEAGK
jgi:uncharacterized membrane protein